MKNTVYFILLIFLLSGCDDDKDGASRTALLTGGSSKQWNITAQTPANDDPNCGPSQAYAQDNTWTFFADGDFTFDRGAIFENETCGDFGNFEGTWTFEEDDTRIFVATGTGPTWVIMDGEIISLSKNELVVGVEVEPGEYYKLTFTPK